MPASDAGGSHVIWIAGAGSVLLLILLIVGSEAMVDAVDFHDEHSNRRGRLPTTGR
jgi:hypothetical protein